MPTIGNITVKKLDGATDIVYSGLQGASGDGVDAQWRQDTSNGLPLGLRQQLYLSARRKPNGDRKMMGRFIGPITYTESTTGLVKQSAVVVLKVEGDIPITQDPTKVSEMAYQGLNLFGSADFRSYFANGLAPT